MIASEGATSHYQPAPDETFVNRFQWRYTDACRISAYSFATTTLINRDVTELYERAAVKAQIVLMQQQIE